MINTLSVATRRKLCSTLKKTLSIAAFGLLIQQDITEPIIQQDVVTKTHYGGGGNSEVRIKNKNQNQKAKFLSFKIKLKGTNKWQHVVYDNKENNDILFLLMNNPLITKENIKLKFNLKTYENEKKFTFTLNQGKI